MGTDSGDLDELTLGELRVLDLMASGLANQSIADSLFLSRRTVECNIRRIYWKLGLRAAGFEHPRVAAVLMYLSQQVTLQEPDESHMYEAA